MIEKWFIVFGEECVIDIEFVICFKVGLVGGQVDVIVYDELGICIEVYGVIIKDFCIEVYDGEVEIDYLQLGWDNFFEVFWNFGFGGFCVEVSVVVFWFIVLNFGVVSVGVFVFGFCNDICFNIVLGDIIVDMFIGDLMVNFVLGDVQVCGFIGLISVNSVLGDVVVMGVVCKVMIDIVLGVIFVDVVGDVNMIIVNLVFGGIIVCFDELFVVNYVICMFSGCFLIDGVECSFFGFSNFIGMMGEFVGCFVDLCVNFVLGGVIVFCCILVFIEDDVEWEV